MARHPLYKTWHGMIYRCTSDNHAQFEDYGGRGIAVCDRWMAPEDGFENFVADMGSRPPEFTLDRIDGDGDYEPANCRWASRLDQCRNRRNSLWYEFDGRSRHLKELADAYGVPYLRLRQRIIKHGWSVEDALAAPLYARITPGAKKRPQLQS